MWKHDLGPWVERKGARRWLTAEDAAKAMTATAIPHSAPPPTSQREKRELGRTGFLPAGFAEKAEAVEAVRVSGTLPIARPHAVTAAPDATELLKTDTLPSGGERYWVKVTGVPPSLLFDVREFLDVTYGRTVDHVVPLAHAKRALGDLQGGAGHTRGALPGFVPLGCEEINWLCIRFERAMEAMRAVHDGHVFMTVVSRMDGNGGLLAYQRRLPQNSDGISRSSPGNAALDSREPAISLREEALGISWCTDERWIAERERMLLDMFAEPLFTSTGVSPREESLASARAPSGSPERFTVGSPDASPTRDAALFRAVSTGHDAASATSMSPVRRSVTLGAGCETRHGDQLSSEVAAGARREEVLPASAEAGHVTKNTVWNRLPASSPEAPGGDGLLESRSAVRGGAETTQRSAAREINLEAKFAMFTPVPRPLQGNCSVLDILCGYDVSSGLGGAHRHVRRGKATATTSTDERGDERTTMVLRAIFWPLRSMKRLITQRVLQNHVGMDASGALRATRHLTRDRNSYSHPMMGDGARAAESERLGSMLSVLYSGRVGDYRMIEKQRALLSRRHFYSRIDGGSPGGPQRSPDSAMPLRESTRSPRSAFFEQPVVFLVAWRPLQFALIRHLATSILVLYLILIAVKRCVFFA